MRAGDTAGQITSGAEALDRARRAKTFKSGSEGLDRILEGGFRTGRLIEFFGRSNSGKSQIAMQGSMMAAAGGALVLYIDSEGAFRPERVKSMADARGMDDEAILSRIIYLRVKSASEQMEAIQTMPAEESTRDVKVVVVDTLTKNFSVDLPGRANMMTRQERLGIHLSEMARDAQMNQRAYLITNRVTFGKDDSDVAVGGGTVTQLVHDSILLRRRGESIEAKSAITGDSVVVSLGLKGVE